MTESKANNQSTLSIAFAVFAIVCVGAFLAFRGSDIGQLPKLVGNLGGGALFAFSGFVESVAAVSFGLGVVVAWFGLGSSLSVLLFRDKKLGRFLVTQQIAIGAALWSLVWFFFGLIGGYSKTVAIIALWVGCIAAIVRAAQMFSDWKERTREPINFWGFAAKRLAEVAAGLSLVAALAPAVAKDTLLYHFSVPKGFISQGSSTFIDGNIASYLALGTEMHTVWAMLSASSISF